MKTTRNIRCHTLGSTYLRALFCKYFPSDKMKASIGREGLEIKSNNCQVIIVYVVA